MQADQKVLIVEDHDATRMWLAQAAEDAFAGTPTVTSSCLAEARAAVQANRIGLALVDINLPDGSGIDLVRELSAASPPVECVMTTIFDDDVHLFAALQAGARGYLIKDQPTERLVARLKGIADGEPPLSPGIARRILLYFQGDMAGEGAEDSLTPREREVLTLVGKGYSRAEIGRLLGITTNTAAGYIKTIYEKLNCSSRAEAVLEAVRLGLVRPGG